RPDAVEAACGILVLPALDPLPLPEEIAPRDLGAGEDVGVPADELLIETPRDLAGVECALLARDLSVDRDLEEKVAELVPQPREIARVQSGEGLVRLLQEMRPQRRVR